MTGSHEVDGSIPFSSTKKSQRPAKTPASFLLSQGLYDQRSIDVHAAWITRPKCNSASTVLFQKEQISIPYLL